jgi:hypothetical protein
LLDNGFGYDGITSVSDVSVLERLMAVISVLFSRSYKRNLPEELEFRGEAGSNTSTVTL